MVAAFTIEADHDVIHDRRQAAPQRAQRRQHLPADHRAAPQLEIDLDVRAYRRRGREAADVFRARVDRRGPRLRVCHITQRLHAARRGAGADGDHVTALRAYRLEARDVVGRGDAALDEGDVDLRPRRVEAHYEFLVVFFLCGV